MRAPEHQGKQHRDKEYKTLHAATGSLSQPWSPHCQIAAQQGQYLVA
jgi:hypothetical protein